MKVGQIEADVLANANQFLSSLKQIKQETKNTFNNISNDANKATENTKKFGDETDKSFNKARESAKKTEKDMKDSLSKISATATAVFVGLVISIKNFVEESNKMSNAMKGLETISKNTNNSFMLVEKAARDLANDGLMTIAEASNGLKNLLSAGFGLEESIKLMNTFKDSASFNRQGMLGFGESVVRATEGVRLQNSMLTDSAGITKNLSQIMKEAGFELEDLSNKQKSVGARQALLNGLMKEGAIFAGDSAKLAGEFSGQTAQLDANMSKLNASLGDGLKPLLAILIKSLNDGIVAITNFSKEHPILTSNIILATTALSGMIAIFAGITFILPKLITMFGAFNAVLLTNPIFLVIAGLAGLVIAINTYMQASKKAEEQQKRFNEELEKTNTIRQNGIEVSQIKNIQAETVELEKLTKAQESYNKLLLEIQKNIDNGIGATDEQRETEQNLYKQVNENEKALNKLGLTYETAKSRIEVYKKAVDDAKKSDYSAIQTSLDKYNSDLKVVSTLNDKIVTYEKLTAKKNLNAKETELLNQTTQDLLVAFGNEIVSGKEVNGITQLNTNLLKDKSKQMKNNIDLEKQSAQASIETARQQIDAEKQVLTAKIESYKERAKMIINLAELDSNGDPSKSVAGQLKSVYMGIGEAEEALKKLDDRRMNLTKITTSSSTTGFVASTSAEKETRKKTNDEILNEKKSVADKEYQLGLKSSEDTIKIYENISKQYAKTEEEKLDILQKIEEIKRNEIEKTYSFSTNWIDKMKALNNLTLEEELQAWLRIQERYKEGSKEKLDADMNINRVKGEITNQQYNSDLEILNNDLAMNKITAQQKTELLTKFKDKYKDNANILQAIDKELADNIVDIWKEANDNIEKAENERYNAEKENLNNRKTALDEAHRERVKQIKDESDEFVKGLERQKTALRESADKEDIAKDLPKLQKLYELYSQSTSAEGLAKAEELRRQIRDLQNRSTEINLDEQIRAKKDETDNLLNVEENKFKENKKLLDEEEYVIEQQHKQILNNTSKFTNDVLNLHVDGQDKIINFLKSKEGDYYSTAKSLADAYTKGYNENIKLANNSLINTFSNSSSSNKSSQIQSPKPIISNVASGIKQSAKNVSSNITNKNITVNLFDTSTKNIASSVDLTLLAKQQANQIRDAVYFGRATY